jgi:hypothetical protein
MCIHVHFLVYYRCRVPGLANDTYDVLRPAQITMTNFTVPLDHKDEEVMQYTSCEIYTGPVTVNSSSSTPGYTIDTNTSGDTSKCDAWVYDTSVYQTTVVSDVSMTSLYIYLM